MSKGCIAQPGSYVAVDDMRLRLAVAGWSGILGMQLNYVRQVVIATRASGSPTLVSRRSPFSSAKPSTGGRAQISPNEHCYDYSGESHQLTPDDRIVYTCRTSAKRKSEHFRQKTKSRGYPVKRSALKWNSFWAPSVSNCWVRILNRCHHDRWSSHSAPDQSPLHAD